MPTTLHRARHAVLTLVAILMSSGCSQYGTVSPAAYEISKSLYSICNRQDPKGIDTVKKVIEAKLTSEEITAQEHGWLLDIVATASGGDWAAAMQDARTMMADQVDY